MAEIKSTMDLVMERAARIGKASSEELRQEEAQKKGVHLAVAYLEGTLQDPMAELRQVDSAIQLPVLRGIGQTLLRNIFLPLDDIQLQRAEKAVRGVMSLEAGSGEIAAICREVTNILGGYREHHEQLRGQLEEQIKMQYENLLAQQQEMQRAGGRVDPTLQPKFQEEWRRVESELNKQYSRALDQLKQQICQRLGIQ